MSMKVIKIVSRDRSFISSAENGQVWVSNDEGRSFTSCGSIINGACNVHKPAHLIWDKKYKDYFPVNLKLLRFAKKFKIKKLRIIYNVSTLGKYGWYRTEKYGYTSVRKFDSLLKKRKHKQVGDNVYVLLKHS